MFSIDLNAARVRLITTVSNKQYVNTQCNNHNPLVAVFTPLMKERHKMKTTTALKQGFTLVEIMIVVAIIGLLAAIAIPNFIKARTTAQKNACINNLRQIDGAIQQWALENKKGPVDPVTFPDISNYLKNAVICPSGGSTFADSYGIDNVGNKPLCQKVPSSHVMPP